MRYNGKATGVEEMLKAPEKYWGCVVNVCGICGCVCTSPLLHWDWLGKLLHWQKNNCLAIILESHSELNRNHSRPWSRPYGHNL